MLLFYQIIRAPGGWVYCLEVSGVGCFFLGGAVLVMESAEEGYSLVDVVG